MAGLTPSSAFLMPTGLSVSPSTLHQPGGSDRPAPVQQQGPKQQSQQVHGGSLVAGVAAVPLGWALALRSRRQQRKKSARAAVAVAADPVEEIIKEFDITPTPDNLREWRKESWEKIKAAGGKWPAPNNDRLLKAARGEAVDRPPKWMMRQAGRYLPEYMAVLNKTDFFTVCRTPALVAEVTLQPIRRYPTLDSMIIFSDILVIPVAMGMPCFMEPKVGPVFDFAISTPEDLDKLNLKPNVEETLSYVFDAVFWTRQEINNDIPVIGFSGAPWTLMGYMVEGKASRTFDNAKKWIYQYPEASKKLLSSLRDTIVEYLVGQYDSGAPLLQVFDTNCGELPPRVYEEFMVPDLKYIAEEVKRQRPNAIMSLFPKDGEIGVFNDSAYDVVGVSWTTSPQAAREMCPDKTLQGNLDPFALYVPELAAETTHKMVREFGVQRYIANLGHGMMPTHPVEGPAAFIKAVDECLDSVISKEAPAAASSSKPANNLVLHMEGDTVVTSPFSEQAARQLQTELEGFITAFKKKMAAEKAEKGDNFDYSWNEKGSSLEVFCNPNAHASIFDVKMFITVKSADQTKVTSEMPLSNLRSDLDAFLS
mmetsp:Transcript_37680/g.88113  ORF Transcript_37680/g.88113 Transcript_37680/m.88113 type:complete len:593 (+) Transcript_37680:64-1842(+)|eukprot:CAMPEP_0178376888 /NCGR_PEP_ID=MMETSP0689_2-20121128/3635_1 /TAXON_ID=160604 /ORGANISM="Amphidinium massartii, Strain CS-259" /LENGTH=592 /DNA_ID=CAMNT_0019996925 /DNA_START=54 /DNA_END=1832 /DNA_ORIENTATION=-